MPKMRIREVKRGTVSGIVMDELITDRQPELCTADVVCLQKLIAGAQ